MKQLTLGELTSMKIESGCIEHDDCFTCPFPDCIRRESNIQRENRTQLRHDEIRNMSKNFSVSQVATYFSVDKRTVKRALKGGANALKES